MNLPILEAGRTTQQDVAELVKIVDDARNRMEQARFLAKEFRGWAEALEKDASSIDAAFTAWLAGQCQTEVKLPAWFGKDGLLDRDFWEDYLGRILNRAEKK